MTQFLRLTRICRLGVVAKAQLVSGVPHDRSLDHPPSASPSSRAGASRWGVLRRQLARTSTRAAHSRANSRSRLSRNHWDARDPPARRPKHDGGNSNLTRRRSGARAPLLRCARGAAARQPRSFRTDPLTSRFALLPHAGGRSQDTNDTRGSPGVLRHVRRGANFVSVLFPLFLPTREETHTAVQLVVGTVRIRSAHRKYSSTMQRD